MAAARLAPARPDDVDDLLALEARCFPDGDLFPRATWRHLLGPAARRRTALTLVARRAGKVVGAAVGLYRAGAEVVRIYSIAVDPAARGLGLGALLIRELVRRSPRRCTVVSLEVRVDNPARVLYEKLGMWVAEKLPGYYDDGTDGVRYRGERNVVVRGL